MSRLYSQLKRHYAKLLSFIDAGIKSKQIEDSAMCYLIRATTTAVVLSVSFLGGRCWAEEALCRVEIKPGVTLTTEAKPSNLSAALRVIKDAQGVLKGTDDAGQLIISTAQGSMKALRNSKAITFLSESVPTNWRPVKRLKVSYGPDNKPKEEDLRIAGLRLIEDYQKGSFMVVEPLSNQIDAQLAGKLEANSRFLFATPVLQIRATPPTNLITAHVLERPLELSPQPNDAYFGKLWGMRSIRALDAWKSVHDSDVVVAVIDSGVDYTHEDLKDNMWDDGQGKHGYNFVENNDDPMDFFGHGTHCAGTIGGRGNNGIGVVGVNWKAKIMAVRWLDENGSGEVVNAIKAIDFAVDHGAKVLSNSWFWIENDPDLEAAIKRASDHQVLFVAAAGNFAKRPNNNGGDNDMQSTYGRYPSAYAIENVIAVAAIDEAEHLAAFSEFGKKTVHLGAPGVLIESTVPHNLYDGTYSGTSMATPHVAGAAALIWANAGPVSATEIKKRILAHARTIDSLKDRCVSGGVLDISFLGQDTN